jgi:hypothetical protein
METPLPSGFRLVTQIDYLRWDYSSSPYLTVFLEDTAISPWRVTFGVRRDLKLPIPWVDCPPPGRARSLKARQPR